MTESAEHWRAVIKRAKGDIQDANDEAAEEDAAPFTLLETSLPLGLLPATPKRVWRSASEAGFVMQGYESRVSFADTHYKTGDRKGELKKAAFEQRNIFFGGYVPDSYLMFKATWLGAKFSAHVNDPVGRYVDDVRQTYWLEKSSRAFEKWIQAWADMLAKASIKEVA